MGHYDEFYEAGEMRSLRERTSDIGWITKAQADGRLDFYEEKRIREWALESRELAEIHRKFDALRRLLT